MDSLSIVSVLTIGFVLGLRHAVEADHVAAVCAIASERKSIWGSSVVGGLWGVGHTFSLLIAGVLVMLFHFEISERAALWLEFVVGLMLVALGLNALRKLARGGHMHFHVHQHGGRKHVHPHIHEGSVDADPHAHHGVGLGRARPIMVGLVHGLAGSAALMLLVLSTIQSALVGFLYIFIFGVGSIGGMMMMSALVGLPLTLTAARFNRAHLVVRGLAGLFSLSFGLFMVYELGFRDGLFR